MRCPFCFANNQSGETCAVCGSPLRLPLQDLPPQKAVADDQSSTRLDEVAVPVSASRSVLPKPTKRKNAAQEQLKTPQQLQLVARRKVEESFLSAAFWSQNRQDETIAFVTRRGEVQLWNPQSDTAQTLVSAPRAKTTSACLMADFDAANGRVVLAFEDGRIELFDVARGASSTRLSGDGAKATSIATASEAQVLAVASEDGTIRLWDLGSVKPTPTVLDLCGLHRVAMAPNATWLACGDDSGQVQVWNVKAQAFAQPQWSFDAHRLWVSSLAFSPNAQMIASGGYDGTVRLYASQNGFEMARFPEPNQGAEFGAVSSLCFAGNRFVAIAFAQGTIALLDCWSGTTTPLAHLSSAITHLAASSGGALLLALCRDEALLLRLPAFSLL